MPCIYWKNKNHDWLETGWLLASFGRKKKEAVNNYKAYVEGIEIKAVKDPEEDIISKARSLAIYLARDLSGVTCNELGDFFGGVSGAAITVRYNKIAEEMAGDKRLKRKVSKIKARIINI